MLKYRRRRLTKAAAVAGSVAVHLGALALIVGAERTAPASLVPPPPIVVSLHRPPPPVPEPPAPPPEPRSEAPASGSSAPAPPAPARPDPPRPAPRAARVVAAPPPEVEPAPAPVAAPVPVFATLSDAQLAGAATAGAGRGAGTGEGTGQGIGPGAGPGGEGAGCDMIGRLQAALRADPEIRAAVAQAHRADGRGRALLVWDGDWVQTPGQAGKGLAGVRQAIALEVAFAPEACRRQPMRGLVLITFEGGARVVFGTASWRWSQMLRR